MCKCLRAKKFSLVGKTDSRTLNNTYLNNLDIFNKVCFILTNPKQSFVFINPNTGVLAFTRMWGGTYHHCLYILKSAISSSSWKLELLLIVYNLQMVSWTIIIHIDFDKILCVLFVHTSFVNVLSSFQSYFWNRDGIFLFFQGID